MYVLGVDLGQAHDFTALAVTEVDGQPKHHKVRHLERLPLGTPYPAQVARVGEVFKKLTGKTPPALVVDATGVGRPVVDMLRAAKLPALAVTITGGDAVSRDRRDWRVPKRDFVSALQVLLQSKRLEVASGLAEAQTLVKELLAFKVTISKQGHDSYGNDWRENPHDDMVLAVALAAWWGERFSGSSWDVVGHAAGSPLGSGDVADKRNIPEALRRLGIEDPAQ